MSQSDDLRSGSAGGLVGPTDERPLTEQEFQQLQRMLGDPFSFPISFKTWLISYLESSDLNLPMSAINGLTAILGIAGLGGGTLGILPAGLIFPYGGDAAPPGSLLCDGASYTRSTQARLFAAIGGKFGTPDSLTFNVPDLRGRGPAGRGVHVDVDTVGKSDGFPVAQRRPTHRTSEVGFDNAGITAGADAQVVAGNSTVVAEAGAHFHGPSDATVDTAPYLVVNFIIVA